MIVSGFNGVGINIYGGAQSNLIGGYTPAERNVISANGWSGISLSGSNTVGNIIAGNYIGLSTTGSNALPNYFYGVELSSGAAGNIVGGSSSGAGNVISGNAGGGVLIRDPGSSGNTVQGNLIGVNAAGSAVVPNGQGINIYGGAQSNLIGGYTSAARNVISGNGWSGVALNDSNTIGNIIAGNYIGLDSTGSLPLSNNFVGIEVNNGTSANVIGGNTPGAGNVISGNAGSGVIIHGPGTSGNIVQANLIGVNAAGSAVVPNGQGINIYGGAQSNLIGGYTSAARNVISGNGWSGVALNDSNTIGNIIAGNYIGLDSTGSLPLSNNFVGIEVNNGTSANVIGGNTPGAGNVISGNAGSGVIVHGPGTSGNIVQANLIGVNAAGSAVVPNGQGINIYGGAQSNLIGGYTSAARNVISGNGWSGVALNDSNTIGNIIAGNYIGLDSTGSLPLSNNFVGIEVNNGTSANVIGGNTPGAGNVISGNAGSGVIIHGPGTSGNIVQANLIGVNAAGSAVVPNGQGINIYGGAQSNLIGGYTSAARNVISGNGWSGVALNDSNTIGNTIAGNFIGVSSTGALALGNLFFGVELDHGTSGNVIGGSSTGAGNVISGNGGGVLILNPGSDDNLVQGNYIGIDATGILALPNSGAGVWIYGGPQSNLIGGASPSSRNVISGNSAQGILISDPGTEGNLIQGNFIGLNASGGGGIANASQGIEIQNGAQSNVVGGGVGYRNFISGNGVYGIAIHDLNTARNIVQGNTIGLDAMSAGAIPNGWAGITVYAGATANQIGGTMLGAANLVASNSGGGILLDNVNTINNTIRGNSVFGNSSRGLALYDGANLSVAAPALSAAAVGTKTTVSGSVFGCVNTIYHVDFYANPAPASTAQAMTYLGYRDVMTGAGGLASFALSLGALIPPGRVITATSTDPAGNTSALSAGLVVTTTSTVNDGIPNAWRAAFFGGNGATTNSQSCATCDPGHDSMNNLQKFLAGLNPTDSADILSLGAVSNNRSNNVVSFLSISGTVYRMESCDDLTLGTWSPLADQIVGTGTNIFIVDPGVSTTGDRFYRLHVLW